MDSSKIDRFQFVDLFPVAVPEFADHVAEHVFDYQGYLPHILLADLVRFMYEARELGHCEVVLKILNFADHALRNGDAYVEEAIWVSFVENADVWKPELGSFVATWPKALRKVAREMGWKPSWIRWLSRSRRTAK